jgi:hypothetical protein
MKELYKAWEHLWLSTGLYKFGKMAHKIKIPEIEVVYILYVLYILYIFVSTTCSIIR